MTDGLPQDEQSQPARAQPPTPPARRPRKGSAVDEVREITFPVVLRGYDRHAVETWREQVAELIERLENAAPRDAAVRRALDEVGQETSAILQRAHESADDITARSRSQAEGRLQRAEREAEMTIREADERAERLEVDTQQIWRDRQRLIEEMRQLADELLGVTDDALDRIASPHKRETDEAEDADETSKAGDGDTDPTSQIATIVDDDDTPMQTAPIERDGPRFKRAAEDEDTVEAPAADDSDAPAGRQ